ncbi:MAG: endonuclease/exonuclease/phosphatase family protein [Phycisphaerales bacterium]|nr:endonuclease/exonuclease/phosphatase family protein [Phycisphaerales bacterium]
MSTVQPDMTGSESIRSWLGRVFSWVGWAAAAGLLSALILARLVDSGPSQFAFLALLVQTFAFHAGLAITVLLLIAVALRRWRLGIALLLGALVTIGPLGLRAMRSTTPPIDGAQTLTVLSCNLSFGRADAASLITWINEIDPDVIVLQEYGGDWPRVVEAQLRARYPHTIEDPQTHAFGSATLSRLPFVESTMFTWAGDQDVRMPRVTIEHEGSAVDIVNVHTLPPIAMSWVRRQMDQTDDLALEGSTRLGERGVSASVAGAVLVGDFNAPWNTNHMRPLARSGFWEAHSRVGSNRGATWGPTRGPMALAPGIRLDHAVYGGDLEPVFSVVGPDVGSDHRPIATGFRWRTQAP